MTENTRRVAEQGPDWPDWAEFRGSDPSDEPYWMTRFHGQVYELDVRPEYRRVFRYRRPDVAHVDFLHEELMLSQEEVMTRLPDLLMEWLL